MDIGGSYTVIVQHPQPYHIARQKKERKKSVTSKKLCSLKFFKNYIKYNHKFPKRGYWDVNSDRPVFHPKTCYLQYGYEIPQVYLNKCLTKLNVSSFLSIGDSMGRRLFDAISDILKCYTIAKENVIKAAEPIPDAKYYVKIGRKEWEHRFNLSKRGCTSCQSKRHKCTFSKTGNEVTNSTSTHNFIIDYFGLTTLHDYSLSFLEGTQTLTSQEFFFTHFVNLMKRKLIILYLPFNHLKNKRNGELKTQFQHIQSLAKKFVQSGTKIIYITTAAESEKVRARTRKSQKYVNRTFTGGMFASERINHIHKLWFNTVKHDLEDDRSETYTLLDFYDMSLDIVDKWSLDGVHLKPIWYKAVASIVLQSLCN